MISGGWFNDRVRAPKGHPDRRPDVWAAVRCCPVLAGSIGFLIVTYGLIGGLGLGMAYGCTISSLREIFPG